MRSIARPELSPDDHEAIFRLATRITGTCQTGKYRRHNLISNVQRRMTKVGVATLAEYLKIVFGDEEEYADFVSALTIHTTSWFRELNQLNRLREFLLAHADAFEGKTVRVLSAACSTGEEVYSLAILMEDCRARIPGFDYQVFGYDIDPRCVGVAKKGVYSLPAMSKIPAVHRRHFLIGDGTNAGFVQVDEAIRGKCAFQVGSLLDEGIHPRGTFDIVFCRNALIYFDEGGVQTILALLAQTLMPTAVLCVGQSEHVSLTRYGMKPQQNAIFSRGLDQERKTRSAVASPRPAKPLVLIIDDSATVRAVLTKAFVDDGFEVQSVATAADATRAVEARRFDAISLDLNLPDEHGAKWLAKQRMGGLKAPVVVISETAESEAVNVLGVLERGAQDFVTKALLSTPGELTPRFRRLIEASSQRKVNPHTVSAKTRGIGAFAEPEVILIGASTGGPHALAQLLTAMSPHCPPVVVVQHIPENFMQALSTRLCQISGLAPGESRNGSPLLKGHLYMALDDYHIAVGRRAGGLCLVHSNASAVMSHRPSVDYLFNSAAGIKAHALAVLLTGMGSDGAQGMVALARLGALNLVQDEASSVIFGMPKEATKLGAASFIGSLKDLRLVIDRVLARPKAAAA